MTRTRPRSASRPGGRRCAARPSCPRRSTSRPPIPPYLDKTNATAIHAALDLPTSAFAVDIVGSVRSAVGAMRAARDARAPGAGRAQRHPHRAAGRRRRARRRRRRRGVPLRRRRARCARAGRAAGRRLGHRGVPRPLAAARRTRPRAQWEERFGEHAYVPLGEAALTEALKSAGVTAPAVTRLIVAGPHGRAVKRVAAAAGVKKEAIGDDFTGQHRQRGRRPRRADVRRHARSARRPTTSSSSSRWPTAPTPASGARPARRHRAVRHRRAGRRRRARGVSHVPHVARLPQARAAAPARSAGAGGAARAPGRGVEVRVHRQPLPGVRRPSPAAAARVREVPRGRQA